MSSGFPALDAELVDGGWPVGCLIEVLHPQPSLLEWRLIGPSLRKLVKGGRSIVVIGHPKRPNLVGLRHLGIEEDTVASAHCKTQYIRPATNLPYVPMTARPKVKTATLTVRIDPRIKAAAEAAAEQDHRSLTSLLEVLIVKHCRSLGLSPDRFPKEPNQ